MEAEVDHFAGPTPLIVTLKAIAKNADGDVSYRWRFDDGTTSTKPEVTHTFSRAGYYQVIAGRPRRERQQRRGIVPVRSLAARAVDEGAAQPAHQEGSVARHSEFSRSARIERRKELREALRRRAREQIEG